MQDLFIFKRPVYLVTVFAFQSLARNCQYVMKGAASGHSSSAFLRPSTAKRLSTSPPSFCSPVLASSSVSTFAEIHIRFFLCLLFHF